MVGFVVNFFRAGGCLEILLLSGDSIEGVVHGGFVVVVAGDDRRRLYFVGRILEVFAPGTSSPGNTRQLFGTSSPGNASKTPGTSSPSNARKTPGTTSAGKTNTMPGASSLGNPGCQVSGRSKKHDTVG